MPPRQRDSTASQNLTADGAQGSVSVTVANATNFKAGTFVLLDEVSGASVAGNPCGLPGQREGLARRPRGVEHELIHKRQEMTTKCLMPKVRYYTHPRRTAGSHVVVLANRPAN